MKDDRFSDAQIMSILKQVEGGVPVCELCRTSRQTHRTQALVAKG